MRPVDRAQEIIDELMDQAILDWDYRKIDLLVELQEILKDLEIKGKQLTKRYLEQKLQKGETSEIKRFMGKSIS